MNTCFTCYGAAALSLLLLTACPQHPAANQATQLPAGGGTTTPAPAPVADSPGCWYRCYRGLLGTDSITLHLLSTPRRANDTEAAGYYGSYYRPAQGQPFELMGEPSAASDSLILMEVGYEQLNADRSGARWRLRREAGGLLRGTRAGQPIQLREDRSAARPALAVRYFADSIAAFPGRPRTPYGQLSLQVLQPLSPNAAALGAGLAHLLRGDSTDAAPAPALDSLWAQQRREFAKMYPEDAAASQPDPADTVGGEFGYGMRYDQQQATYVYWNEPPLLSVGVFSFSYTGGVHGNYGTRAATFDTRSGRRLRYDDIFRPADPRKLPAVLGRAVRRALGLKPRQPLDELLFVKQMPVTKNVYLTAGGAVFIYQPYEIASYAMGEIRVFVPLSELRGLLREGLPLPESGGGVAAR